MLSFEEMVMRLAVAIALGALVGLEREWIGKEAGVRTDIMVAAGSAIFTMIGLNLPYLIGGTSEEISLILAHNSGFLALIGNIVVGIGFLGAGIIVKHGTHVRGLTTAATVWFVAAVGVLSGAGLAAFAAFATALMTVLLVILRKINLGAEFSEAHESKNGE